jgi:CheY-like chemotaxis protein
MGKKILVVDDEPDVREFLGTVLEDGGFEVVTAADGSEALAIAQDENPDLVILDLAMPMQTGTDFYRRLARDKQLRDTPIIVVSGLAGRDLAIRKPVAVFDKPIDSEEFLAAVNEALA